ncbi:MAG TPA: hypothetical protein VLX58_15150 [Bryobacteraceae bacterium]|nr:hypothetical protein [Bryobacteraceae bacterium]
MDTRPKIIEPAALEELVARLRAKGSRLKVVTGHFDVLVAEHLRRLREIRDGSSELIIVVTEPPAPLLPARARAELVASLGMVDYVVPAGEQATRELLTHFAADEIVREETADLLRARRLVEHVQRQNQQ